jgi:D5 N terminal like
MSELEGRPGEEYTGAAPEPVSSEPSKDTPGGYRLSLVDDAAGTKAAADDFAAEFEELLAAAEAEYNNFEPPKDQGNDSDSRGDDSVQDALRDSPPGDVGPQRLEDAHIGERIARDHLQEFVHAKGFGWMKFDERRWKSVEQTIVDEVVRQALIDFHRSEAQSGAEPSRLQQISRMLSANKIRAIAYITKLCRTTEETFDGHPDLLNVRNGVVDLRDGILRPHDPNLMLTKVTMAGDTRPMAFRALKRRIGRAVFGHLREDHRCRQPGNGQPCRQPPGLEPTTLANNATGRQRQEPPPLTGSTRTTATRRSSTPMRRTAALASAGRPPYRRACYSGIQIPKKLKPHPFWP